MKKTKRFAAAIAAIGIMASMIAMIPASASTGYTPITGGTVAFDKYLVMDKDATTPNVSFEYKIAPGTALDATETTQAIIAGPAGAKFTHVTDDDVTVSGTDNTVATVAFKPTDTTVMDENADAQKTIDFNDNTSGNEKFVTKAVTVDLSGVHFSEPGIYRYVITESATTAGGIVADANPVRYLDVYVINNEGKLEVRAKVFQTDDSQPAYTQAITTGDKKSTGFTNKYATNELTLEKIVSGNQSSKNKYFKFTVSLTNPTGADAIAVDNDDRFAILGTLDRAPEENEATDSHYTTAIMTAENGVTYVTYEDILDGKDFYLKGGQSVIINGIPKGLGYTIKEVNEDYKPTIAVSGDTKNETAGDIAALDQGIATVSDKKIETDATVKYTNFRGGSIPTGILNTIKGSAAIAALGLAGIVGGTVIVKKKKSEDEE